MIAGDRNAWCFPEMVKAINAATVNSKIYDFGEPNEVNGNGKRRKRLFFLHYYEG